MLVITFLPNKGELSDTHQLGNYPISITSDDEYVYVVSTSSNIYRLEKGDLSNK